MKDFKRWLRFYLCKAGIHRWHYGQQNYPVQGIEMRVCQRCGCTHQQAATWERRRWYRYKNEKVIHSIISLLIYSSNCLFL